MLEDLEMWVMQVKSVSVFMLWEKLINKNILYINFFLMNWENVDNIFTLVVMIFLFQFTEPVF